jgi:hypothetical protein
MTMHRSTFQRPNVGATRIRIRWDRIILAASVVIMSVTTVAVLAVGVRIAADVPGPLIDGLAPCATEDSDNCYWDATSHGNGDGLSFAMVNGQLIPWCTDAIIASEAICWGPLR